MGLVHFAALEDIEGFGLYGGFAGAVAHFGETGLEDGEFGGEFGEFDVDGFDVRVDLWGGLARVKMGHGRGTGGRGGWGVGGGT